MVEIDLNFKGYYYPNDPVIPDLPSVYCIYSTKQAQAQTDPNKRELVELRYIGQSGKSGTAGNAGKATLRSRIRQHATSDYPASEQYLYSFVVLRRDQLDMVEAALVFHFKPRDNDRLTEKYTHSDVDITIDGDCAGLEKSFRLYKDTERF